jgi:hypothetical protein
MRCQPLCPVHYEKMVLQVASPLAPAVSEGRYYSCAVSSCELNYSPELGYFATEQNDDMWQGTRSPSIRVRSYPIQAVCGEQHKLLMYLESLGEGGKVENFRCPEDSCQQTLQVERGGPPAYWLSEAFFRSS